jgi:hypothetical protein
MVVAGFDVFADLCFEFNWRKIMSLLINIIFRMESNRYSFSMRKVRSFADYLPFSHRKTDGV